MLVQVGRWLLDRTGNGAFNTTTTTATTSAGNPLQLAARAPAAEIFSASSRNREKEREMIWIIFTWIG
jgi:hypothetical protein